MASYYVSIELHERSDGSRPTAAEYAQLQKAMEAGGFARTILGPSSTRFFLPHGGYHGSTSDDVGVVKERVNEIVSPIWARFGLFVSTCGDFDVHGLLRA